MRDHFPADPVIQIVGTGGPRFIAASLLLVGSFGMGLLFHGTMTNLVVLALVGAAWLVALMCLGANGVAKAFQQNRCGVAYALVMLGYLLVMYRLSISPDSSFAASWVLAAAPLTFVAASAIAPFRAPRRVLEGSVVAVVVGLATVSAYRFVFFGERAHSPLVDPNNYAALMYLVWIPLVHRHLTDGWRELRLSPIRHSVFLVASFVLVLALIATRSRTSLLIVAAAFVVWIVLTVARRLSPKLLLAHGGAVALAMGISIAATALTDAPQKGLGFSGGVSVRVELLRSAFQIFEQHPLGVGIFGFPLLYPSVRSVAEQDTAGLFVHNDYVQFLVEGGVPLLALLITFVALVARRAMRLTRLEPNDEQSANLGVAMALMVVCAHASVNFVFYSIPLGILIGLLSAQLFTGVVVPAVEPKPRLPASRATVWAAIALGWVMWSFLALDVVTVGVFQEQPSLGIATSIRADDQRMLRFARFAQRINDSRGIPALGEAMLLYRATRAEPESRYLWQQTYDQFHRAIEVDPWNTLSYVRFAQFLNEFPPAGDRAPGESEEELLFSAIGLDRVYVPALDQLLAYYAATAQESKRYELLRNIVYPWMPTLRRNYPEACTRYFDLLAGFASATGDTAFLNELTERRRVVLSVKPREQDSSLF